MREDQQIVVINRPLREIQSTTSVPGLPVSGSSPNSEAGDFAPASDGVQLSRLGGVLNVFHTSADRASLRIDQLAPLVRNQGYSIDGLELSRKMISEMLQKQ